MATILTAIAPLVLSILQYLLNNKIKKDADKKKYLGYIEFWEKHRVTPVEHSEDIDEHLGE